MSKQKIILTTGDGVKYDITPDTFEKLEQNHERETTNPQDTDDKGKSVKITSHTIKPGVGFRL